jgi:hypothetical protein
VPDTPSPEAAPLDAYVTAAPDEPVWTVQGGDPLGGPLLRIWAVFARLQAGIITPGAVDGLFAEILGRANNSPPENDRERDGLLLRATATEEISWDMDAYRSGATDAAEPQKVGGENSLDEKARLDLHDRRVRVAQRLSNFAAEARELCDLLLPFAAEIPDEGGWLRDLQYISHVCSLASDRIEPRRLFRQP